MSERGQRPTGGSPADATSETRYRSAMRWRVKAQAGNHVDATRPDDAFGDCSTNVRGSAEQRLGSPCVQPSGGRGGTRGTNRIFGAAPFHLRCPAGPCGWLRDAAGSSPAQAVEDEDPLGRRGRFEGGPARHRRRRTRFPACRDAGVSVGLRCSRVTMLIPVAAAIDPNDWPGRTIQNIGPGGFGLS
jgi:hypothetical protein